MSAIPQFALRSARPAQQRRGGLVAELIADRAVLALLHELAAWPKPGLVSHVDSGSHTDMDAAMMQSSAEALRPFFAELAMAGQEGADMGCLRTIGLRAESAMLAATGGVNTHRGAIFGLGLLCAAAGTSPNYRRKVQRLRRCASDKSSCGDGRRTSSEVRSHSSATALRRSAAMVRAAREPRRPADFAAFMRWAGPPCGKAAHCNPTTLAHHPCRHASR
jgi:triphosphoribosyl-dephospho-CoA synthetase